VRGRADDRVNHGRPGWKGLYGWQANNSADRLTRPLVRDGGQMRKASWDEAMNLIVQRFSRAAGVDGTAVARMPATNSHVPAPS